MENNYVLAMYDICGKQEYIYKSNRMKEIIGGSLIIEDCFTDYLYPSAEAISDSKKGIYNGDDSFDRQQFSKRVEEGYLGEVVYEGGGNCFIMYKDKETFIKVNKEFTSRVLKEVATLRVESTCIGNLNFDDYKADQTRLYEQHEINKRRNTIHTMRQVMPFTQVDLESNMPLYKKIKSIKGTEENSEKVSKENFQKYKKYEAFMKNKKEDEKGRILDNLVTKKGEESLLAVIYIDGNNMGEKVKNCILNDSSYEECVKHLRIFSNSIKQNYIVDRIKDIDAKLYDKHGTEGDNKNLRHRRFVISAGDEITFICNARDSYEVAKVYLEGLSNSSADYSECNSACAGIAIFHSHAPFADVYRIAEECCESGKQKMKKLQLKDANYIDIHYCQTGIGIDLESIREHEVGDLISKPWLLNCKKYEIDAECIKEKNIVTIQQVEQMVDLLNQLGHSNIKGLAGTAQSSMNALAMDLKRIEAHNNVALDLSLGGMIDEKTKRKMIYDISTLYDVVFRYSMSKEGHVNELL